MLRLDGWTIHRMGSIPHVEVDLSAFGDALLIAVTGTNGIGKSTMLEVAGPGSLYRKCPTRGTPPARTLQSLARARDSFVVSKWFDGSSHLEIRHDLDSLGKRAGETLLKKDGRPAYSGTKVSDFDAWAERHLPKPELYLTSAFAPQGSGGFLSEEPGNRKGIVLRALGIEHYEDLAEGARKHDRDTKAELETLRARIDDERRRGGDPSAIEREIETLEATANGSREALATARATLEAARSGAPGLEIARLEAQQTREKRADLSARIAAKRQELRGIEERIANNRTELLDKADEIRAAKTRSEELTAEIARLGEELKAAEERRLADVRERDEHAGRFAAAQKRFEAASLRASRARVRLELKPVVEAAIAHLPAGEAALESDKRVEADLDGELQAARGKRVAGAEERVVVLRNALEDIGDANDLYGGATADGRLEDVASLARDTLKKDDAAAVEALEVPKLVAELEAALTLARDRVAVQTRKVADLRAMAARLDEMTEAERERDEASQAGAEAHQEAQEAARARDEAERLAQEHDAARAAAQAARAAADEELRKLAPLVARVKPLGEAEGRIAELEPQATAARTALAELETALEAIPEPPATPEAPDVTALEQRVEAAEKAAASAAEAVSLARDRLQRAKDSATLVEGLEADARRLESELSDWTRLAAELGRDGLQAAEIDCAGPELTELVNDLLRTCYGPRWTVSVETTKPSADGKKILEGCEIRVLDTEKGREGVGQTFSGGERVIIGEAVSLALSMLGCRRSGLRGMTLIRDESGAFLSPDNARAYVKMLRRAAEIVGASRVLFVAHLPAVIELADATIDLEALIASAAQPAEALTESAAE